MVKSYEQRLQARPQLIAVIHLAAYLLQIVAHMRLASQSLSRTGICWKLDGHRARFRTSTASFVRDGPAVATE